MRKANYVTAEIGVSLILATGFIFGGESVPLPQKIIDAKKVFLVNDAAYQPSFEKIYGWFKKWGRYELVNSEGSADLIVTFLVKGTGMRTGSGGPISIEYTDFVLQFADAKTKTTLWTETSQYLGNVFKNFKKRVEKHESAK